MGALYDELMTDPNSYGYRQFIDNGDDNGLAELLNVVRPNITIHQLVPRYLVKNQLFSSGDMLKLKQSTEPEALMFLLYLEDPDYENIDFTLPVISQFMRALLDKGVMSSASLDLFNAYSIRYGSRVEQLGLDFVSIEMIAKELRG